MSGFLHDREQIKSLIEQRFKLYVKGKSPDLRNYNKNHDGAEGDWLTKAMGLQVNGKNEPDFLGFEMKKDSSKTTFGDWSPSEALFTARNRRESAELSRSEFLRIFGTPKKNLDPRKNGRFSWSGEVFPNIRGVNRYGQVMEINYRHGIEAIYQFELDSRSKKFEIVPQRFQAGRILLARWSHDSMKLRLERKFNQLGWFKCLKDSSGKYTAIQFGKPINYTTFIQLVGSGDIFCDCGMHEGNARPYMTWRANHRIWEMLAE